MKIDLAKQTSGHSLMPFWTFGRIGVIKNTLLKSKALTFRVYLKLDVFLC
jgi:hypothetical protein